MSNKARASAKRGFALEELIVQILKANFWNVLSEEQSIDDIDVLAIENERKYTVAIEVKYTRNSSYPTGALKRAAQRLFEVAYKNKIESAMLIVAADIKQEIKNSVESQYTLKIIDLNELLDMASIDLELLGKLVKLCEVDLDARQLGNFSQNRLEPQPLDRAKDKLLHDPIKIEGNDLIQRLKDIPAGKDGWQDYEAFGSQVLKYLFDDNLAGWHEQKVTSDEIHRYDLICRVIDNTNLWKFIGHNLDSRYVLFEFKNYKDSVPQSQIYSTEKYLLEKAKRKVCFLLSRKGLTDNAILSCQGAMREHGKLILS